MLIHLPKKYPDVRQYTFSRRDSIPLKSDILWRIQRGVVRTITWQDDGTVIALGYWGRGDIVGKPLSRLPIYEIQCLTMVEASAIPSHQFSQILDGIFRHSQETEELMNIINLIPIEERLLKILVWLSQKFGRQVNSGQLIDLRLTHQSMAELIGTTRVTVTRLLKQFEQKGIISRHPRSFITVNLARD